MNDKLFDPPHEDAPSGVFERSNAVGMVKTDPCTMARAALEEELQDLPLPDDLEERLFNVAKAWHHLDREGVPHEQIVAQLSTSSAPMTHQDLPEEWTRMPLSIGRDTNFNDNSVFGVVEQPVVTVGYDLVSGEDTETLTGAQNELKVSRKRLTSKGTTSWLRWSAVALVAASAAIVATSARLSSLTRDTTPQSIARDTATTAPPSRLWHSTGLRPSLMEIHPGIFEVDGRRVQITKSFAIAVTEVTQAQYAQTMGGSNPSRFTTGSDALERPVEQVTFEEAAKYCNALSLKDLGPDSACYDFQSGKVTWRDGLACRGYRLPTEAEWVLAARNEQSLPDGVVLSELAWYDVNSRVEYDSGFRCSDLTVGSEGFCGTHRVGQKARNANDMFDTIGNVREWVWDLWAPIKLSQLAADPTGPFDGENRTVKGCGWKDKKEDCTVHRRWFSDPTSRHSAVGFRVARSLGSEDEGERRTIK